MGLPPGRRINILIINDEERAMRILSNGHCKRITGQPRSPSKAKDAAESDQHKQNGGHSVKVTVEYNLDVRSLSGDIAVLHDSMLLKDNSFKKITAAKRSITIDGDNLITYASFCDGNSKIGIVSNSGTFLADTDPVSGNTVSSCSISLPDLNCNRQNKQPPPKPKRNQTSANKKASIIEADAEKCSNNVPASVTEAANLLDTDISSVNGIQDLPTSNSDAKRRSLGADLAQEQRRYSSTSATDTDGEVIQSSPNLSRSEDCLCSSSREVLLTNSSSLGNENAGFFGAHANVAFTESSGEMRTSL